jgi:flagellar protein FliS
VLDSALRFDGTKMETIRKDFLEIRQAMMGN